MAAAANDLSAIRDAMLANASVHDDARFLPACEDQEIVENWDAKEAAALDEMRRKVALALCKDSVRGKRRLSQQRGDARPSGVGGVVGGNSDAETTQSEMTDEEEERTEEDVEVLDEELDEGALQRALAKVEAEHSNFTLMRFVVARKWDIDAAVEQYVAQVRWRNYMKPERWVHEEPAYRALVPESFHGFDRDGNPSWIVRAGRVEPSLVSQLTVADFIWTHVWGNEYSVYRCQRASAKLGKHVHKFSNIVDLSGLGMKHFGLLPYLKPVTKLDERYYPESLAHTFIVNAPFIFQAMWKVIKRWVDPVTQSKIFVLGSDYKKKLLEFYEPEQLPVEYGGTCECPGGCVPVHSKDDIREILSREEAKKDLTQVRVSAGKSISQSVEICPYGAFVEAYFRTASNDIKFEAIFTPASGGKPRTLHERAKVKSHKSPMKLGFTVWEAGTVTITWDNSYSTWTAKELTYCVEVRQHDENVEYVSDMEMEA